MDIQLQAIKGNIVVTLAGRWDSKTSPDVEAQLLPVIQPGSCILLDLTGVSYMSSSGLRTLLILYRSVTEGQGRIVLAGLSERLQDTMLITGFLHHFTVYDTVENGLAALAS